MLLWCKHEKESLSFSFSFKHTIKQREICENVVSKKFRNRLIPFTFVLDFAVLRCLTSGTSKVCVHSILLRPISGIPLGCYCFTVSHHLRIWLFVSTYGLRQYLPEELTNRVNDHCPFLNIVSESSLLSVYTNVGMRALILYCSCSKCLWSDLVVARGGS